VQLTGVELGGLGIGGCESATGIRNAGKPLAKRDDRFISAWDKSSLRFSIVHNDNYGKQMT
jgi:hypothetical protein